MDSLQNTQRISENSNQDEEEQEVMVMCHLPEMTKLFIKEYIFIWYDPHSLSKKYPLCTEELQSYYEAKIFSEWDECFSLITKEKIDCHILISGPDTEILTKELLNNSTIMKPIYVFNDDFTPEKISRARSDKKKLCLENQIENLVKTIKKSMTEWQRKSSSLRGGLPAFSTIFDDYDKSMINKLHYYLIGLTHFESRIQAKRDFVSLSKTCYSTKRYYTEFEAYDQYDMEKILKWYTTDTFLYKATNNCLRIATSDSVNYCRLVLRDVEEAIKEQFKLKSREFRGLLYRAAFISDEEWSLLEKNVGKDIEMLGFLSTSKSEKVASNFQNRDKQKKVFMTLIVPKCPPQEDQGFAEVKEFSNYPEEDEVLFNVRSRFTVIKATDEKDEGRHLVLLYGKEAWKTHIQEKEPAYDIQIDYQNPIQCIECKKFIPISKQMSFYASLTSVGHYICSEKCFTNNPANNKEPLLYIQGVQEDCLEETYRVEGKIMEFPKDQKVEFYGYECHKCHKSDFECYYKCITCQESEKTYCKLCIEANTECQQNGHKILLERRPFSFIHQKMTEAEINYKKYQAEKRKKQGDYEQGETFMKTQEFEKAEEYFLRVLKICRRENGDNHSKTADLYNRLGDICFNQRKYSQAQESYFQALEIRKTFHEETHAEMATVYHNLGLTFEGRGEPEKARDFFEKALAIRIKVYGEQNLDTADTYNELGWVHKGMSEFPQAIEYYNKSLEIRKSIFKGYHPDVAISYNNLGGVYNILLKFDEALKSHEESLKITISIDGEHHPSTASTYSKIGNVHHFSKRYSKAKEYFLKCLKIRESVFGEEHADTAICYKNLGKVFTKLKDYQEAQKYYEKSIEVRQKTFGLNHHTTATSYHELGKFYKSKMDYVQAERYLHKAFEIREKSLKKADHHHFADSFNDLGKVYYLLGNYEKALEYVKKAFDMRKKQYGDNHIMTRKSSNNLAKIIQALGENNQETSLKPTILREEQYKN